MVNNVSISLELMSCLDRADRLGFALGRLFNLPKLADRHSAPHHLYHFPE